MPLAIIHGPIILWLLNARGDTLMTKKVVSLVVPDGGEHEGHEQEIEPVPGP